MKPLTLAVDPVVARASQDPGLGGNTVDGVHGTLEGISWSNMALVA
jgi:hypothetical protein